MVDVPDFVGDIPTCISQIDQHHVVIIWYVKCPPPPPRPALLERCMPPGKWSGSTPWKVAHLWEGLANPPPPPAAARRLELYEANVD